MHTHFLNFFSNIVVVLDSEPELTEKHLTILTTKLLWDLNDQNLRTLGSALGLSYAHQKRLTDPLDDMVSEWLKGRDNVATNGKDTRNWNDLIKALEQCHMGGTAARVRRVMLDLISSYANSLSYLYCYSMLPVSRNSVTWKEQLMKSERYVHI